MQQLRHTLLFKHSQFFFNSMRVAESQANRHHSYETSCHRKDKTPQVNNSRQCVDFRKHPSSALLHKCFLLNSIFCITSLLKASTLAQPKIEVTSDNMQSYSRFCHVHRGGTPSVYIKEKEQNIPWRHCFKVTYFQCSQHASFTQQHHQRRPTKFF